MTVHALDEILTAVSLGRLEIMWEVVRCSQLAIPHKKKDAFHFKEKQQDGQKNKKLETNEISLVVGFLLERTIHVQSLLLKYRTAICHHKIQALKVRDHLLRLSLSLTWGLDRIRGSIVVFLSAFIRFCVVWRTKSKSGCDWLDILRGWRYG